jgi:DNA-binding transcriptional LysR family regulator
MQFFQQSGFNPTVVQEAMQLQTMISLVALGVGVARVPASLQNLQRAGVVYRCLQELTPEVAIAIAWRQQDDGSPILQKFIDAVRELV